MGPHEELAAWYMSQKGYPDIQYRDVVKLDGKPCWYFVYDMPEGTLELEVFYKEQAKSWEITVTTFALHEERTRTDDGQSAWTQLYSGEK